MIVSWNEVPCNEGMDQSLDTTSHTLTSLQTLVILLISLEETKECILSLD